MMHDRKVILTPQLESLVNETYARMYRSKLPVSKLPFEYMKEKVASKIAGHDDMKLSVSHDSSGDFRTITTRMNPTAKSL